MYQLVDLSAAQDIEAGDGTTSVVVLAGSFLGAAEMKLYEITLNFEGKHVQLLPHSVFRRNCFSSGLASTSRVMISGFAELDAQFGWLDDGDPL